MRIQWDESQKTVARRVTGLGVAAFTVFTLIAALSYLGTWRVDQSLLSDPAMMDAGVGVSNAAGKLGFRLGHLLVCEWFGLGSFALLVILTAVAVRLITGKWRFSLLRTTLLALSGAFVASLVLALAGTLAGADTAFGGGLGGRLGHFLIGWSRNLVGLAVTVLGVVLLAFGWLFLASRRFSDWVAGFGRAADQPETEPAEEKELQPAVSLMPETPAAPEAPEEKPARKRQREKLREGTGPDGNEPPAQEGEGPETEGTLEVIEGEGYSTEIKKPLPRIDMRAEEVPAYKMPTLDILETYAESKKEVSPEEMTRNNNKIRAVLANYKIQVLEVKAVPGPSVTLYKVYPAPGVRISEIRKLQEDIAMSLNARGVRVVTLEDSVGIEVANDNASIVPLRAMLNDRSFRESKAELPVAIGYTITQKVKVFDLADTPHLLIAGATKQGKSVGLNVIVSSLLYSKHPSELKLVFIDPKMVEFSSYAQLLKHYLAVLPDAADEQDELNAAIVKKPKEAEKILRSLCIEMDDRYELLSKAFVNNVKLYNEKYKDRHLLPTEGHHFMPYMVVVVDEYADLTMSVGASAESKAIAKSIQTSIIRLAQKGRAAGIHVILATQRPSVDVISGIIKTNFPTRIAFRVASRIDSQTILDTPGAEKLIGKGDMLYYAGVETERVQCAFISNDEINAITRYIGAQTGYRQCYNTPYYLPSPAPAEGEAGGAGIDMNDLDERFEEAAKLVVMTQKGSTSDLQRRLGMGYAKAGRVMDQLEAAGIVGPQEGSKPRQVLVQDLDELSTILKTFGR